MKLKFLNEIIEIVKQHITERKSKLQNELMIIESETYYWNELYNELMITESETYYWNEYFIIA